MLDMYINLIIVCLISLLINCHFIAKWIFKKLDELGLDIYEED